MEENETESHDELDARIAAMQAEQQAEPIPEETPEPVEATEEPQEPVEEAPKDEDEDAQARIQRMYYESREAKRKAKALEHELEALRGNRVENRDEVVAREAQYLAQQMSQQDIWIRETNRVLDAGRKEIKGFDEALNTLAAAFPEAGGVPRELTESALLEPELAHRIVYHYSQNLDLAEQLVNMTPMQRGAAIGRVAAKLSAPKKVSSAPPPIKPVGASAASAPAPTKDFSKMSTAEQIRFYDEEDNKARKARGY